MVVVMASWEEKKMCSGGRLVLLAGCHSLHLWRGSKSEKEGAGRQKKGRQEAAKEEVEGRQVSEV